MKRTEKSHDDVLYLLFPCSSNVRIIWYMTRVVHYLQRLIGFVIAVEMLLDHVHLRVHVPKSKKKNFTMCFVYLFGKIYFSSLTTTSFESGDKLRVLT